jgi:adenosine deaminase
MKPIVIKDNKLEKLNWEVEQILAKSKDDLINHLINEEWYERVSYQGLTYAEIQELEYYNQ